MANSERRYVVYEAVIHDPSSKLGNMAIWAKDKRKQKAIEAEEKLKAEKELIRIMLIDSEVIFKINFSNRWGVQNYGKCVFCKRVFTSLVDEFSNTSLKRK